MKTLNAFKIILQGLAATILTQTPASGAPDSSPIDRITSYKQIFLSSNFQDAQIYVGSGASESRMKSLILKQLTYLNGQLRMQDGQAEVAQTKIELLQLGPVNGGKRLVRYRFRTRISWDRARPTPESIEMILPAYSEGAGLESFYSAFGNACSDENPTLGNFFYHFAPLKPGCPFSQSTYKNDALFFRTQGKLTLSADNTSNKAPEYVQVWRDGKLIITAMYSKYESGETSDADAGIEAYNLSYTRLMETFGPPTYISDTFSGVPGAARPSLELHFQSRRGPIIIYMRLVDRLSTEGSSFVKWYESKTPQSDLILYNGHAGLGGNVQRLTKIGKFSPGQYQIMFINGCTTFSYINQNIWLLHGSVNPGFAPSKHLDVMLNSLPSYFDQNDDTTIVMMQAMIEARQNYSEILSQLDPAQRALVDGEEDNP